MQKEIEELRTKRAQAEARTAQAEKAKLLLLDEKDNVEGRLNEALRQVQILNAKLNTAVDAEATRKVSPKNVSKVTNISLEHTSDTDGELASIKDGGDESGTDLDFDDIFSSDSAQSEIDTWENLYTPEPEKSSDNQQPPPYVAFDPESTSEITNNYKSMAIDLLIRRVDTTVERAVQYLEFTDYNVDHAESLFSETGGLDLTSEEYFARHNC